jgi:hypothetical protein
MRGRGDFLEVAAAGGHLRQPRSERGRLSCVLLNSVVCRPACISSYSIWLSLLPAQWTDLEPTGAGPDPEPATVGRRADLEQLAVVVAELLRRVGLSALDRVAPLKHLAMLAKGTRGKRWTPEKRWVQPRIEIGGTIPMSEFIDFVQ